MRSLKVHEYEDPVDFLYKVTSLDRFNNDYSSDWVYRGHSDSSFPLLPTIVRNFNYASIHNYINTTILKDGLMLVENVVDSIFNQFSKHYKTIKNENKRLTQIIYLSILESYLVDEFISESNRAVLEVPSLDLKQFDFLNFSTTIYSIINKYLIIDEKTKAIDPESGKPLLQPLKFILAEQNREYINSRNISNYSNISEHSLARHHGIPSTLLDWTTDPKVATLFATIREGRRKRKDICVWCFNKRYVDQYISIHDKIILRGLKFLTVQKGLFIEMLSFYDHYLFDGKWPTLEQYILNYQNSLDGILEKIVLKSERVDDLIKILDTLGYKKHIYMPTYDNVGQYVTPEFMK